MINYKQFLQNKLSIITTKGFDISLDEIDNQLFDFQKAIVKWAIQKGKGAVFAECGLGKSIIQLEWAKQIVKKENKPVLIIAPLSVSYQTIEEAKKFKMECIFYDKNTEIIENKIYITNYEKLENLDTNMFCGVVLDESSILKGFSSKTKQLIIEKFNNVNYKLACTATPSPNDFVELGNHSEFLNVMSYNEMLSMFFINDMQQANTWRLKYHAYNKFWEWVASWAILIKHPSNLNFNNHNDFNLPKLHIKNIICEDNLHNMESFFAITLQDRRQARKNNLDVKTDKILELIKNKPDEQFLLWCGLNIESQILHKNILASIEITGTNDIEYKIEKLLDFANGKEKYLITKPKIAGFGMNLQSCHNIIFCGLSDSYESFYQSLRRCWRFGQKEEVNVYIIISQSEITVLNNILNKDSKNKIMEDKMINITKTINLKEIDNLEIKEPENYNETEIKNNTFHIFNADCVEIMRNLPDKSIDYSIFSPPFAQLYVYSNSERDMGNSKSYKQFLTHFRFFAKELYRILADGRLFSFHCMNLPISKQMEGYIGIRDFRGQLIRLFEKQGFVFHSEVCIWKNPVVAMQRTKALGLLHKQIKKDSSKCRQGIADYLVTMIKPGQNLKPIKNTNESFPVDLWQEYASPVWMDINPSDTLQFQSAKDNNDEKHICPLQLPIIRRALKLWSTKDDTVLSPFMGIGSEGYEAIKANRKFIGIELKKSYFDSAKKNMFKAIMERDNIRNTLFAI